jgi:hypothetical protein
VGRFGISSDNSIEWNARWVRNKTLSDHFLDLLCSHPTPFVEERLSGCSITERAKGEKELLDVREEDLGWRDNPAATLKQPLWI